MIIISPNIKELKSRELVTLKCECCSGCFSRPKNQVYAVLKGSAKTKLKYCSKRCQSYMQRTKQSVVCRQCSKEFHKSKSEIGRTKNNFCSRSCAAIWNNKHSKRTYGPAKKVHDPKKQVFYHCRKCNEKVSRNNMYCRKHRPNPPLNYCITCKTNIKSSNEHYKSHGHSHILISDKTIAESENSVTRPANRYRVIRDQARNIAKKSNMLDKCKICGYCKHIVVCHIKEISSFSKQSMISEVNDLSNIIGLCKNHHWEMDNNLLSNEDEKKLKDY